MAILFSALLLIPAISLSNADDSIIATTNSDIPNPLKQIQNGTSLDEIMCRDDRILMLRPNSEPACVYDTTVGNLEMRGWNIFVATLAIGNTSSPDGDIAISNFTGHDKLFLNPKNIIDAIPQDVTFDYELKMPPDDPDAFAKRMIDFFNDTLIEITRHEDINRYVTERGWVEISKNPVLISYLSAEFVYTFYSVGRINPAHADSVTDALINELSITIDDTVIYTEGHSYVDYDHRWTQTYGDEYIIYSNEISTDFEPGYTFIRIGSWSSDLSEMQLYNITKAWDDNTEYIFRYAELTGPECNVGYDKASGIGGGLLILYGRPVYEFYAGACTIPIDANHSRWFSIWVDALTGKPLFISDRILF